MKRFNVNSYIYIQITELGWEHLRETLESPIQKADDYIKYCIIPAKVIINNEEWYKLQAHHVFSLFNGKSGFKPLYNTNILFDNEDLEDFNPNK